MTMIAAIVVALVAIGLVTDRLATGHPTSPARARSSAAAVPAGLPDTLVGVTSSDALVVASTRTGHVIRMLASDVTLQAPGLPDVSVTPDGTVFFDSAGLSSFDTGAWGGGDQIFAVPITGGPVTHVAAGFDP